MNTNISEERLRAMLEEAASAFSPLGNLKQAMRAPLMYELEVRIVQETIAPRHFVKDKNAIVVALGASVAIAVASLIAWLAMTAVGRNTLYAEAMEALKEAASVHAVTEQLKDGHWEKLAEAWYQRGVGLAEWNYYAGQVTTRIDDGKHQWLHSSTDDFAIRSKSVDPMGIMARLLSMDELTNEATREPTGDRVLNGLPCQMHVLSKRAWQMRLWTDETGRLMRWEKAHLNGAGAWETYRVGKVQYDVPLDRSRFLARFGPNVRIVDADKLLDHHFGLEKALFKKEVMGIVFAVHELERCENGMVYILCSSRPTEQTVRELGPIISRQHGARHYANFELELWKRVKGAERYYRPTRLAELYHNGLVASWILVDLKGRWSQQLDKLEIGVHVYTRSKLQEKLKAEGVDWHRRFSPLAVLPLPKKRRPSIDEVFAKVYSDAQALESVVFQVVLRHVKPRAEGTSLRRRYSPSDISQEQFVAEAKQKILGAK